MNDVDLRIESDGDYGIWVDNSPVTIVNGRAHPPLHLSAGPHVAAWIVVGAKGTKIKIIVVVNGAPVVVFDSEIPDASGSYSSTGGFNV